MPHDEENDAEQSFGFEDMDEAEQADLCEAQEDDEQEDWAAASEEHDEGLGPDPNYDYQLDHHRYVNDWKPRGY